MTAATINPAALPPGMADLLSRAVDLSIDLGELPSRNRLMAELRIGAAKAATVREALTRVDWPTVRATVDAAPDLGTKLRRVALVMVTGDPGPPVEPEPTPEHVTRLHLVTDLPPEPPPTGDTTSPDDGLPESTPPAAPAPAITPEATDPLPIPVTVEDQAATSAVPTSAAKPVRSWPVLLLALPAFVAIWSGWVGLGGLTGFGIVHPLPGIWPSLSLNTAITLPVGVETYAAYALRAWLTPGAPRRARRFAKASAIGSLTLGALGQVTYHLMTAAGMTTAPWPVTTLVACLPVAVLGMGAALAHLLHNPDA